MARRFTAQIRSWQLGLAAPWCEARPAPTPFQTSAWLDTWYGAFAGPSVEPVFVEVQDETGERVLALPLVRNSQGGRTTIEFADLGVTDYNLPLLGEAPPADADEARAVWDAVSRALPSADLLVLRKMPETCGAVPNPILMVHGGHVSHLFGNLIDTNDDLEAWRLSLHGHTRAEFRRIWRVFQKSPDARFVHAKTALEAAPLLAWLEESQRARSEQLGRGQDDYLLDRPEYTRFYRNYLADQIERGGIVLTALVSGENIVAVSYALASGTHYAAVRIAFNSAFYSCSPARLLLERTLTALHAEGFRTFDLTTGDYPHKRSFEVRHWPLRDVTLARSIRGLPVAGIVHTKAFVKAHPGLERLARRLMALKPGSPASVPEKKNAA